MSEEPIHVRVAVVGKERGKLDAREIVEAFFSMIVRANSKSKVWGDPNDAQGVLTSK